MRIRINALNASHRGNSIVVNMIIPSVFKNVIQTILDTFRKGIEYDIKPYKAKRSLDANAYFWKLADELAKKLNTTKESVYRRAIYNAGKFDIIEAKDTPTKKASEIAETFCKKWKLNGLGWYAYQDKVRPEIVYMYYGSSVYDSSEMSRIIDFVQQECIAQGIEVKPKEEVEALLKQWRGGN